ncbi:zinc knuckle CX2CX4HX4C containing protein, partial [Tanacetum coccineum]
MTVHKKNSVHQKATSQIERTSSLPEKPNPVSLTIPCSVDIFSINAIADLGASINIMSKSMLDELSLADPKYANIIVEMADKTREVSLGIKEDMVKIKMKEQERNTTVGEHLNKRLTSHAELSHRAVNKTHWYDNVNNITKERILQKFGDNKLGGQIREKILTEEQEDPEKCKETKEREIIRAMVNKLPEEWFSEVNIDKDDLEGIIDYLEPILYDGFIDYYDEAYKQRRSKTEANIADIRAEIIEGRKSSSEDLSNTKRRHWCKPIYQWKDDVCTKWASCNPYFDECDGGDNPMENKEYWESSNDDIRTTLEWESLSFDNWVRVAFGK